MRAKAFPRYRHLPNLIVCDSRRSPTSASLLSLFRGNDVKAFTTAAIEDDTGTKTASDGALSDRILREGVGQKVDRPSVPRLEASFLGKGDSKVAHNINASICNA